MKSERTNRLIYWGLTALVAMVFMGSAIASHLEHGISMAAPALVQTFLLGVAFYRFPELRSRLLNGKG
ncbi:MAG: hypothetical protein RJA19_1742 [Bacteroidota bacterium]